MTTNRDLERLLDAWFADGPSEVADRVIDDVADRIERQPQYPAWRLRPWRTLMSPTFKLVAAAAAVLVVAVIGYNLLPPRQASVGGPTPAASPSPASSSEAPTPTAAAVRSGPPITCDDPAFQCAGALSAGNHSTVAFKPSFTFEVPAGWTNTLDRDRTYTVNQLNRAFFFQVLSQVAIPAQNATCAAERKADTGAAVADFVTFLTTHPGLAASAPESITVGAFAGTRVTVHVNTAWTATCPNSIGPAVVLLTDSGAIPTRSVWIDDQYTTLTILDVGGTTVVLRLESGPTAAANAADQTVVQPIIDSFRFTPEP
jgi:hypothetical protein